ncbi:MAG: hypothetical protein AAF911_00200 [Planctomycetota bacterium]
MWRFCFSAQLLSLILIFAAVPAKGQILYGFTAIQDENPFRFPEKDLSDVGLWPNKDVVRIYSDFFNAAGWGLWEFDLSSLPRNASITDARFRIQIGAPADDSLAGIPSGTVPVGFYGSEGTGGELFTGQEHLNLENFSGTVDVLQRRPGEIVNIDFTDEGISFINTLLIARENEEVFYRLNAWSQRINTRATFNTLESSGPETFQPLLLLTVIPEPSSFMLLIAVCGLMYCRKRMAVSIELRSS